MEGILPALESAHAIAYGMKLASEMRADQTSQHSRLGKADPAYDSQNPFSI